MDKGAWRATVHGVTELDRTERLTRPHTEVFYFYLLIFTAIKPWLHRERVPAVQPLFCFLLFLIMFFHTFQEAISAGGVIPVLSVYLNSLGKNLAFILFVSDNASCTLCTL